jgi:hypothetical protein
MAQEVARVTLEEARAEADRIRVAAENEAARIRAEARGEAEQFERELHSMEAQIATLSKQLAALEAERAPSTPVGDPAPPSAPVEGVPALSELRRLLDTHAQPRGTRPQPPSGTPTAAPERPTSAADEGGRSKAEPRLPEPPPTFVSDGAIGAEVGNGFDVGGVATQVRTVVDEPVPEPVVRVSQDEAQAQRWVTAVPWGSVMPMVGVVVVLIVVLVLLG